MTTIYENIVNELTRHVDSRIRDILLSVAANHWKVMNRDEELFWQSVGELVYWLTVTLEDEHTASEFIRRRVSLTASFEPHRTNIKLGTYINFCESCAVRSFVRPFKNNKSKRMSFLIWSLINTYCCLLCFAVEKLERFLNSESTPDRRFFRFLENENISKPITLYNLLYHHHNLLPLTNSSEWCLGVLLAYLTLETNFGDKTSKFLTTHKFNGFWSN